MLQKIKQLGATTHFASYSTGTARISVWVPQEKMGASINVKLVGLLEENGYYIDDAESDGIRASKQMSVDDFAKLYKEVSKMEE